MKANQGVILLMLAALILWLVWSSKSPLKTSQSSTVSGGTSTPAGTIGGTADAVATACTNVDAKTRQQIRSYYSSHVMGGILGDAASVAAGAIKMFPHVSIDCLRAIAFNMENAK